MPTVSVTLIGSNTQGYVIVVKPWLVIVSKGKGDFVEWESTHPMKIKFTGGSQFEGMIGNGTKKPKTKKIKATAQPNTTYHYTIEFHKGGKKWITVDPDYRIDP